MPNAFGGLCVTPTMVNFKASLLQQTDELSITLLKKGKELHFIY